MTWHFDVSGTDLYIWSHTQDPASDSAYQTLTDENGWTWGDHPDAVLDVMHDGAQAAIQSGDVQRAVAITLDMAGEQIQRVEQ
jgi:4-hydroxy-L-threonine phosphate dehydrogenase PdxA